MCSCALSCPTVSAKIPQPDSDAISLLEEVVGYLNFSSGTSDTGFLKNINQLFRTIESAQPRGRKFSDLVQLDAANARTPARRWRRLC